MELQNYIKGIVDEIVNKFPTASCRYEYHDLSDTHFIELLPLELYRSEAFVAYYSNVILNFIDEYPVESICILSSDAIIKLKDIVYEKSGIAADTIKVISSPICNIPQNAILTYSFSNKTLNLAA